MVLISVNSQIIFLACQVLSFQANKIGSEHANVGAASTLPVLGQTSDFFQQSSKYAPSHDQSTKASSKDGSKDIYEITKRFPEVIKEPKNDNSNYTHKNHNVYCRSPQSSGRKNKEVSEQEPAVPSESSFQKFLARIQGLKISAPFFGYEMNTEDSKDGKSPGSRTVKVSAPFVGVETKMKDEESEE